MTGFTGMVVSSCYRNPRSFRPLVDRLIFPRSGAADRDDRRPVTGDHNALCDFYRPPDQLRALIHLERVFNGFVTTFPPNRVTSPHVSSCRPDARRLTRRMIDYLHPEWQEEGNYGFLAFYNRCYFSAIKDLLDRNGFTNARFNFLYYQSIYFNFSILYLC